MNDIEKRAINEIAFYLSHYKHLSIPMYMLKNALDMGDEDDFAALMLDLQRGGRIVRHCMPPYDIWSNSVFLPLEGPHDDSD